MHPTQKKINTTDPKEWSRRTIRKRRQNYVQSKILQGLPVADALKDIKIMQKATRLNNFTFDLELFFFKPCIYFLLAKGQIVYIGETECLMSRISSHVNDNSKIFDNVRFVPFEGTKQQRKDREANEIKFHRPHYNLIHNNDR